MQRHVVEEDRRGYTFAESGDGSNVVISTISVKESLYTCSIYLFYNMRPDPPHGQSEVAMESSGEGGVMS